MYISEILAITQIAIIKLISKKVPTIKKNVIYSELPVLNIGQLFIKTFLFIYNYMKHDFLDIQHQYPSMNKLHFRYVVQC